MKKRMTRNISIMAVLTLLMGVVLALYISNTSSVPDADTCPPAMVTVTVTSLR